MRNIVLVGFMGTGKTVVGKRLARKFNMDFVNTDDKIVNREKRPITEIFAKFQEPYFRKVEKEVVREVSGMDNVVIAAGGGVVLDGENIENLKKKGVIICLNAAPSTIYERTKRHKHRPLLNVADPIKKINELLTSRLPFYARADYQIDTSDLTVDQVVDKILEIVKK